MLVFEQLATDDEQIQWEGQMPEGDDVEAAVRAAGFVPLPVKKGDLVAIHGQVDHLSLSNVSPKSRHTYQLHLVR
jgi:phytanoyl-CoA hydroxylase